MVKQGGLAMRYHSAAEIKRLAQILPLLPAYNRLDHLWLCRFLGAGGGDDAP